MLLYIFVCITFFVCLVHNIINNNKNARLIRSIPGLKDHFLVGNALHILVSPVELFRLGRVWAKQFNGIYKFYAYPHAAVNIYNPEDIEIVTSTMKHHEKSAIYNFIRPWLRDGLLLSDGKKWQHRRKILTSAFHFNVLRHYFIILQENAQRLVEEITKVPKGEPTDVTALIAEFTLNAICETAMGTQLSEESTGKGKLYKDAIQKVSNVIYDRFVRMYLYPDFIFKLSPLSKQQDKHLSVIHNFTSQVIKDRKDNIERGTINQIEKIDDHDVHISNHKKNKMVMLDLLIAAEKEGQIDTSGIQEEVDTFMFEGHDTTSAALTYSLMLLANDNTVQEKIVAELRDIYGNTKRLATMDDLTKMQYLERCIKESLRLYPPVYFISRRLCETVKLSNYTVPKDTFCHIHIYDLHRRPDLFKDPLKFDPDRFLPENSVGRHNFAYIPFSAGPRNCIGQKFAIIQLKLALSSIIRKFELIPVTKQADIKCKSDIILRNTSSIYVKFNERSDGGI